MRALFRRLSIVLVCLGGAIGCGDDFEPSPAGPNEDASGGSAGAEPDAGSDGSDGSGGTAGASGGAGGGAGSGGDEPNGSPCADSGECESGFCVDGVCCESACTGSDPACAGTCDGSGKCEFPGASTVCGASSCSNGSQSTSTCGGDGSCKTETTPCGEYACDATACKSSCTTGADCASSAWCNASVCEPKKDNGSACSAAAECSSGFCEGGTCCASACAAPLSCGSGTCLCNGKQCNAGATCITWFPDLDGDGFGKSSPAEAAGCSDTPPVIGGKPASKLSTDCDDASKDAFPGQTAYFDVPRPNGSYDYNCDGSESIRYGSVPLSTTCKACGISTGGSCQTCVSGFATGVALTCTGSCGAGTTHAYKNTPTPTCGQGATLYSCQGATSCGVTQVTQANVKQPCR